MVLVDIANGLLKSFNFDSFLRNFAAPEDYKTVADCICSQFIYLDTSEYTYQNTPLVSTIGDCSIGVLGALLKISIGNSLPTPDQIKQLLLWVLQSSVLLKYYPSKSKNTKSSYSTLDGSRVSKLTGER